MCREYVGVRWAAEQPSLVRACMRCVTRDLSPRCNLGARTRCQNASNKPGEYRFNTAPNRRKLHENSICSAIFAGMFQAMPHNMLPIGLLCCAL